MTAERNARAERNLKLAQYLRCIEPVMVSGEKGGRVKQQCGCEGWRAPSNAPTRRDDDAPCAQCSHRLSSHGDLLNAKLDDLDRRLRVIASIESLGPLIDSPLTDPHAREARTSTRNELRAQLLAINKPLQNKRSASEGKKEDPVVPMDISAPAASTHAPSSSASASASFVARPAPNGPAATATATTELPPPPTTIPIPPPLENTGESITRDEQARREFAQGILRTELVTNDDTPLHLEYLIELKNIFSRQLPKMPREYIVRLVFDHTHRSLALIKNDKVIGGIAFRTFRPQSFIEIAFCAVTATEQVRGYGTYMMNHLKEYMRKEMLLHFLTFADNFAIGYFKKQGFTREIQMKTKWQGYIKDYDGGTLMHCVIQPNINYLEIPQLVKVQREAIRKKLEEVSSSHIVYRGLEFDDAKTEPVRIPIKNVRGIQSNFIEPVSRSEVERLHAFLTDLLEQLKSQNHLSWPFLDPVDANEVPDYYSVIKDPMDLKTMESRLRSGKYYIIKEIFMADVSRMADNCRKYNREDTPYYDCANAIEEYVQQKLRAYHPTPRSTTAQAH